MSGIIARRRRRLPALVASVRQAVAQLERLLVLQVGADAQLVIAGSVRVVLDVEPAPSLRRQGAARVLVTWHEHAGDGVVLLRSQHISWDQLQAILTRATEEDE